MLKGAHPVRSNSTWKASGATKTTAKSKKGKGKEKEKEPESEEEQVVDKKPVKKPKGKIVYQPTKGDDLVNFFGVSYLLVWFSPFDRADENAGQVAPIITAPQPKASLPRPKHLIPPSKPVVVIPDIIQTDPLEFDPDDDVEKPVVSTSLRIRYSLTFLRNLQSPVAVEYSFPKRSRSPVRYAFPTPPGQRRR